MLSAALSNRLLPPSNASHPAVVVLSDTLTEPSLAVLRHFIHRALAPSSTLETPSASAKGKHRAEEEQVILVCLEQEPESLWSSARSSDLGSNRVRVVDATLTGPYLPSTPSAGPSTTNNETHSRIHVDVSAPRGSDHLVQAIRTSLNSLSSTSSSSAPNLSTNHKPPVLVVIDSVNALAEELEGGNGEALRVVRRIRDLVNECPRGSRLLLVHHDDFPPSASTSTATLQPALLPYLRSPALSPSTLHLTLHPSAYLELLSREYGFSPDPVELASDPRLGSFVESLKRRRVGNPWKRPERADEDDERIELGGLSRSGGGGGGGVRQQGSGVGGPVDPKGHDTHEGCIVEWSLRGLEEQPVSGGGGRSASGGTASRSLRGPPGTTGPGAGEAKRIVRTGFVGARLRHGQQTGNVEVVEVEVGEVLDPKRMGVRAAAMAAVREQPQGGESTKNLPPPIPATSSSSANTAGAAAPPPDLPFSLNLTDSQRQARSLVSNPYAGADKPIYGQEGYQVPVVPGLGVAGGTGVLGGGGGGIEYVADRGDDLDEEDPDEDLEL